MHVHVSSELAFLSQALLFVGLPYLIWKSTPLKRWTPLVVVQILCGVLMGPSVLGAFWPGLFAEGDLFGPSSIKFLNGLSWLALFLFGLTTGLHFDAREIFSRGKAFVITALAATLVPFALCFGGGVWLFQNYGSQLAGSKASLWTFALGMGIAGGVTALPVLASILRETGVIHHRDGKLALGMATASDGLLWLMVAVLNVLMQGNSGAAHGNNAGSGLGQIIFTVVGFITYLAIMIFFIRPQLVRLNVKHEMHEDEEKALKAWLKAGKPTAPKKDSHGNWQSTLDHFKSLNWIQRQLAFQNDLKSSDIIKLGLGALISALITEVLGMHFLLGAFIFGAVIPKSEVLKLSQSPEHFNQEGSRFALKRIFTKITDNQGVEAGFDKEIDHTPATHNLERIELEILEHSANDPLGVDSHRRTYLWASNASLGHEIEEKLNGVLQVWLLPFFFMKTGIQTKFAIGQTSIMVIFGTITVLSMIGKLGGTMIPAKSLPGFTWRDSAYLGALMQCKGLMEVVVLTILLNAGVITQEAFSGLLFMALVTTALTKPFMLLIKALPGKGKSLIPRPPTLMEEDLLVSEELAE